MPNCPPEILTMVQETEDALVAVGALVARSPDATLEDAVPEADLKLRDAFRRAEALQRWFLIHRAPTPGEYDPRDLPRVLSGTLSLANLLPSEEGAPTCEGDLAQVVCCLKLLAENVRLEGNGVFRAELRASEVPAILVTLDGEGTLPVALSLEGLLPVAWDRFVVCWERATRGGVVNRAGGRLLLGLEGDGPAQLAPAAAMESAWNAAYRLSRRLRSWRGATGQHEPGMVSTEEMRVLYTDTVQQALVDLGTLRGRMAA